MPDAAALTGSVERLLERDRRIVIAGLLAIAALAWAYMLYLAFRMEAMDVSPAETICDTRALDVIADSLRRKHRNQKETR